MDKWYGFERTRAKEIAMPYMTKELMMDTRKAWLLDNSPERYRELKHQRKLDSHLQFMADWGWQVLESLMKDGMAEDAAMEIVNENVLAPYIFRDDTAEVNNTEELQCDESNLWIDCSDFGQVLPFKGIVPSELKIAINKRIRQHQQFQEDINFVRSFDPLVFGGLPELEYGETIHFSNKQTFIFLEACIDIMLECNEYGFDEMKAYMDCFVTPWRKRTVIYGFPTAYWRKLKKVDAELAGKMSDREVVIEAMLNNY